MAHRQELRAHYNDRRIERITSLRRQCKIMELENKMEDVEFEELKDALHIPDHDACMDKVMSIIEKTTADIGEESELLVYLEELDSTGRFPTADSKSPDYMFTFKKEIEAQKEKTETEMNNLRAIMADLTAKVTHIESLLSTSSPKADPTARIEALESKVGAARADIKDIKAIVNDSKTMAVQSNSEVRQLRSDINDQLYGSNFFAEIAEMADVKGKSPKRIIQNGEIGLFAKISPILTMLGKRIVKNSGHGGGFIVEDFEADHLKAFSSNLRKLCTLPTLNTFTDSRVDNISDDYTAMKKKIEEIENEVGEISVNILQEGTQALRDQYSNSHLVRAFGPVTNWEFSQASDSYGKLVPGGDNGEKLRNLMIDQFNNDNNSLYKKVFLNKEIKDIVPTFAAFTSSPKLKQRQIALSIESDVLKNLIEVYGGVEADQPQKNTQDNQGGNVQKFHCRHCKIEREFRGNTCDVCGWTWGTNVKNADAPPSQGGQGAPSAPSGLAGEGKVHQGGDGNGGREDGGAAAVPQW